MLGPVECRFLRKNGLADTWSSVDQNALRRMMKTREEVKNIDPIEIKCPENVVRKEELMDLDYVVNEIQNKFCLK